MVIPHGVLFRGRMKVKIRQQLIKENLLDAVIGLPANLFFGTDFPAAILLFKRSRADSDVLFIDTSHASSNRAKIKAVCTKRILPKSSKLTGHLRRLRNTLTTPSSEEIKENDFNLKIPRYVDTFEDEKEIDIKAVQAEIVDLERELVTIRTQMDKYLRELNLI